MPSLIPSPFELMIAAISISVIAMVAFEISQRKRQKQLTDLAREWGMQFRPRDAFDLADRVAAHLPVMGAADVRVSNLIYGSEPGGRRYIFVAEFTVGVVRTKHRRRCVVSVLESTGPNNAPASDTIRIAPMELPLLEQYRTLRDV